MSPKAKRRRTRSSTRQRSTKNCQCCDDNTSKEDGCSASSSPGTALVKIPATLTVKTRSKVELKNQTESSLQKVQEYSKRVTRLSQVTVPLEANGHGTQRTLMTTSNSPTSKQAIPKSPTDKLKPVEVQLIAGKLALCPHCGFASIDFNQCLRCKHKLPKNVKQLSDDKNASSTQTGTVCTLRTQNGTGSTSTQTGTESTSTQTSAAPRRTQIGTGSTSTQTGAVPRKTKTGTESTSTQTANGPARTRTGTGSTSTQTGAGPRRTQTAGTGSTSTQTGARPRKTQTGTESTSSQTANGPARTRTGTRSYTSTRTGTGPTITETSITATNPSEQMEDDENWQEACYTVEMRDEHVLINELYCDVLFIVGEAAVRVKAHKNYLAKSSPVFENMFYKSTLVEQVIQLRDVNVDAFRAMIRYIYVGKLTLNIYNYNVVCELLSLAKKYKLCKRLQSKIRHYIWSKLLMKNVLIAIEFAKNNDEPVILDTAWKVLKLKAESVLSNHDSFLNISSETLLEILKENFLQIDENSLFNACKLWAENALRKEDREVTSANLREVMLPFIPYIRFLLMSFKEFTDGPAASGVLNESEVCAIFKAKSSPLNISLPPNFSTSTVVRQVQDIKTLSVCSQLPTNLPQIGVTLPFNSNECFINACLLKKEYNTVKLVGVTLPSQSKLHNVGDGYKENITIIVVDDDTRKILAKQQFVAQVKYDNLINVVFDEAVMFLGGCTKMKINVSFHVNGTYPTHVQHLSLQDTSKVKVFGPYKDVYIRSNIAFKFIKFIYYTESGDDDDDTSDSDVSSEY